MVSDFTSNIIDPYYRILKDSGSIQVALGVDNNLQMVSIHDRIKELIKKLFIMLNIDSNDPIKGLKEFFMLKDFEQIDQFVYSVLEIVVIFCFSLILNNSEHALIHLYSYRENFEKDSEQWLKINTLCYFWNKHKEIMQIHSLSEQKTFLFRDKSFFSEEKYIFNRIIHKAFSSQHDIENRIIDIIFALHIIHNS